MKMDAKKWLLAAGAALLVVAGIAAAVFLSTPRAVLWESMTMEATLPGEHGVEPTTAFALHVPRAATEEELRAMLRPEPKLTYTLSGGGESWVLTPEEPLTKNTVYSFRVLDAGGVLVRSFAFQTQSSLLVSGRYPHKDMSGAAIDTGIEITFNTNDVNLSGYFQIEPETAGSFLMRGDTSIFVPAEPLAWDSTYRVTLKAGLTAPNGMVLEGDDSFTFQTEENEKVRKMKLVGSFYETFLPDDPLLIEASGKYIDHVAFAFTVHRLANTQAYAAELRARKAYYDEERVGPRLDYIVKTSGLTEVLRSQQEFFEIEDGSYFDEIWWRAKLPEALPEGCYVITVQGEDLMGTQQFFQKLVQVSSLSVYTQAANGDMLVWLNSTADGQPVPGLQAQVESTDGKQRCEGTSDSEGVAALRTGKLGDGWLTVYDGENAVYFDRASLQEKADRTLQDRYYFALYMDREIFHPTDTVRVWGALRPRHGEKLPESVWVKLAVYNDDFLYKVEAPVAADGTFTAELSFTKLGENYRFNYDVYVTDEAGETYGIGMIWIENFTKPPLVLDVQAERPWYFADEDVGITFSASYYDGTPAAGMEMDISGAFVKETELVTMEDGEQFIGEKAITAVLDARGEGAYRGRAAYEDWYGWTPRSFGFSVNSAASLEMYSYADGETLLVPSRYAFDAKETAPGVAVLRAAAFRTDAIKTDKEVSAYDWVWEDPYEKYAGAPASLDVTITLMKQLEHKEIRSTRYDEIEKKTVVSYKYTYEDVTLETRQVHIDGTTTIDLGDAWRAAAEAGEYRWAVITFDGGYGYLVQDGMALYRDELDKERFNWMGDWYTFVPEHEIRKTRFAVGESVELGLFWNYERVQNEGRVLYTVVQESMGKPVVFEGATATIPFTKQSIPGFGVVGAYFDGRHIFPVYEYTVGYDYRGSTLAMSVETERESYAPGEEISLTLTLKNAAGNPVAGSACVGIVDESIFALAPQEIDIAGGFYRYFSTPYVSQTCSYDVHGPIGPTFTDSESGPGTTGGGGGDAAPDVRTDFKDTAAFQAVTVDESGTATVKLTLPDNITNWRLTAVAVTPNGEAGNATGSTIATLPFYVRAVVTDTYVDGDDIAAGVLAVGKELAPEEDVAYTARLLDKDGNALDEKTWSAKAGVQTYVNFGKHGQGLYTLYVEARGGAYADAQELPLAVAKTAVIARVTERMDLADVANVQAQRWPVTVGVFDESLEVYIQGLEALAWCNYGSERTEVLAAAYLARGERMGLLPEEQRWSVWENPLLRSIQHGSGAAPLPDAEPDTALTAKLAMAAPELMMANYAREYLCGVLVDPAATQDSRVMAYAGLAALREPVLYDVKGQLTNKTLTTAQRLYLGAGLASLGDFDGALAVYEACAAQKQQGENGALYFAGKGAEGVQTTGAALLLCSIAGHPDAQGLMRHLLDTKALEPRADEAVLVNLEMLSYVRNFRFNVGQSGIFEYMHEGKRQRVQLGTRGMKYITLTAEEFAGARIKAVRGELAAYVTYWGEAEQPESDPGYVTVQKTVYVEDGVIFAPGTARVEIELHFSETAPDGAYTFSDAIPSGMRWVDGSGANYDQYFSAWDFLRNEGQQVNGMLWYTGQRQAAEYRAALKLAQAEKHPAGGAAQTQDSPVTDGTADAPAGTEQAAYEDGAVDNPVTDEDWPSEELPPEPQYDYKFTYYVNCPLPGEFMFENVVVLDENGRPITGGGADEVTITGKAAAK